MCHVHNWYVRYVLLIVSSDVSCDYSYALIRFLQDFSDNNDMSLGTPLPILLHLCRSDDLLAGCITLNSCMRLSYAAPHLSLLLLIKFLNFWCAGLSFLRGLYCSFTRGERVVYCFGLVCLSGKFWLTINVCPSVAYLEMTWCLASRF